jgi:hypothetical protein
MVSGKHRAEVEPHQARVAVAGALTAGALLLAPVAVALATPGVAHAAGPTGGGSGNPGDPGGVPGPGGGGSGGPGSPGSPGGSGPGGVGGTTHPCAHNPLRVITHVVTHLLHPAPLTHR